MLDLSKDAIFKSASEIAAVTEVYEYVTQEHCFMESEVEFLLKFQNPLDVLSDGRNAQLYDVRDTIDWIMKDQERTLQKGGYELMPDDSEYASVVPEAPQKAEATGEKTSVMDRIRQHAAEQRELPNLPKDAPSRKKYDPEL
jgi:hypothetical protein